MAEYSRMASGQVVSTGGQTAVIIPFLPDYIHITNTTRITAGAGVYTAFWEKDMGQGAAVVNTVNVGSFITAATGTGFRTFQAGLSNQLGPTVLLGAGGSITKNAGAPLITTTAPHGLVVGDVVIFSNLYQTATTGMQQIAGIPFKVATTPLTTTFTIDFDTSGSNFTAIAAGGLNTLASFKQVLYPALYAPDVAIVTGVAVAADGINTLITTNVPTNVEIGSEVGFHIPTAWGTVELNELPNVLIPGSPQYFYVISVVDADHFVVNVPFASLTAFNANQPFASFPGLKYPMVVPVGDVNSGGWPFTGSQLYPSPLIFNGFQGSIALANRVRTINGPAIQGAFINATFMGFTIGSAISGTAADTIFWRAYMHDINYP